MAWNSNKDPLEYIEQRVKYYEKSISKFINLKKSGKLSDRFSDEQFDQIIENATLRKKQFEVALLLIAQNYEKVISGE